MIRSLLFISLALLSYAHADLEAVDKDRACSNLELMACINAEKYASSSCGKDCFIFTVKNDKQEGCPAMCKCTDCKKVIGNNRAATIDGEEEDRRRGKTADWKACRPRMCEVPSLDYFKKVLVQMRAKITSIKRERNSFKSRCSRYKQQISVFMESVETAKHECSTMDGHVKFRRDQIAQLRGDIGQLNKKYAECQRSQKSIPNLERQVNHYRQLTVTYQKRVVKYQRAYARLRGYISRLNSQIHRYSSQIHNLNYQATNWRHKSVTVTRHFRSMTTKYVKWRKQITHEANCMIRKAKYMMRIIQQSGFGNVGGWGSNHYSNANQRTKFQREIRVVQRSFRSCNTDIRRLNTCMAKKF